MFRPAFRPQSRPGSRPALLLVAHGSRDPRHAATMSALTARVRRLLPGARVETGYLDFDTPSVDGALGRLYAAGAREVIAVPLLLTRAFHAKTDIPAALEEARAARPGLAVRQTCVLGPHPLLVTALERRLRETGLTPGLAPRTGVVLASAGSSDPEASAVIAEIAREWRHTGRWCAVRPAFASATTPTTADAIRALRADGIRQVAVAPYVLAPGRLPDRIAAGARETEADFLAPVLGAGPEVARLVVERYAAAAGRRPQLSAAAA